MMIKEIGYSAIFLFLSNFASGQDLLLYKQVDTSRLYLEVHTPENSSSTTGHAAMVFFFGGGWVGGNRHQFLKHAEYFSQRGLTCFLADYRTKNKHGITPFECLKDAKSAIRYIRKNAVELNIDPNRIIGSGGSAGGHLAAATALIEDYNDSQDDLSVSCIPDALVLFNPVIDNGPGGYGYERIGSAFKNFSPLHNIKSEAPPTIMFLGTEDNLIPVETGAYYCKALEQVGSMCELKLFKKQGHGFFNYQNFKYYKKTVKATDQFLQFLDYIQEQPFIKIE
jgi:acetyl esterase/lipase